MNGDLTRNQALVRKHERVDDLQNGYFLIQDPGKFCFGQDAVFLASFTALRPGERVMDLGTGNGIIPLLLAARSKENCIVGLEIQEDCADLARRNILYNGLENRIRVDTGDLRGAAKMYEAASFHVVTANPPYMPAEHGKTNTDISKTIARHEVLCTFEDVAKQASYLLKDRGRLCLVHRPYRMAEVFSTLTENRLEPKKIRLVHPYADREPKLILIEAVKSANPGLLVEPPLIVWEKPGVYTEEVRDIYDSGTKSRSPRRACT